MNSSPESTMSSVASVLRVNEGLMTTLSLLAGLPLSLCLVGMIVQAAGVSLKPLIFIVGLTAPVLFALIFAQLVRARRPAPTEPAADGLPTQQGKFLERTRIFGEDVPAFLIRDAKATMPGIFDQAEVAESGVTLNVETVLVAQFPTPREARRAVTSYQEAFLLRNMTGDETRGWKAKRSLQGDYVEMLCRGRVLFVWTGMSPDACSARKERSQVDSLLPAPASTSPGPLLPEFQALAKLARLDSVKALGVLLLAAVYVAWLFKGAAWAASTTAVSTMPPMTGPELMKRLMSINNLNVPIQIEQGATPNELIIGWRQADTEWVSHAQAQEQVRSFQIRLTIDAPLHTVRATDYFTHFKGANVRDADHATWTAATGISFFQPEQQQVFGLTLDRQGFFKPQPGYHYHFDLLEMRSPFVSAVTRAGWNWQPTVWQGPEWLRWLTE